MDIIDKILQRPEIVNNPPVLVDVGSSGELNQQWKKIAKYSICIAFDADDREIDFLEQESKEYKKLIIFKRILTDLEQDKLDFYLTKSPFCSSALSPENDKLSAWYFHPLFEIEKKVKLKAVTLPRVLQETGLQQIDWFKTDSQGTDLRIFKSLEDSIIDKTLVAEFEPGIMDAYEGEDKLYEIMAYMHEKEFWMSQIQVKGTHRIPTSMINSKLSKFHQSALTKTLVKSPGWGEVTYFNSLKNPAFGIREYLLAYVFAFVQKQYGLALEITQQAKVRFDEDLFNVLEKRAFREIKKQNYNPWLYLHKGCNKFFQLFIS